MKSWLSCFFSSCLRHLKIPKVWSRALVVELHKPKNPVEDPKSYRLIFLLCARTTSSRGSYTLVLNRLLTHFSLGCRLGSDGEGQPWIRTVLLTQNIEDLFEAKKKAGAVFVNLTAANDTVWHRGLTCKLLRLLPDKHIVQIIMELVHNRSFTLTTVNSKQSRLRCLRNGLPQRSVLAPLLFNIYTCDLPSMTSQKNAYTDGSALLYASRDWKAMEHTLSQDMTTLFAYLQN